ncbi:MAG: TonB family protein [Chlorobiaceae bacterium]|nr:TonB family protein [Chlorobiaceae bacterium]
MNTRDELRQAQRKFSVWLGIAAAAHVAVIIAVIVLQVFYVRTHPPTKIVSVSLVSLPGLPGPAGGPKSLPEPAPVEVKEPPAPAPAPVVKKVPEPVAVKKVPAPPVPQPKKMPEPVVVKKVPDPVVVKKVPEPVVAPKKEPPVDAAKLRQQNMNNALDQLAKKTTTQKPPASAGSDVSDMSSAMANLQKKLNAQGGGGPAPVGSGRGGGGGAYGTGGGAVDPYKAKIFEIITNNWTPPPAPMLRNMSAMEVTVRVRILPDGTIGDQTFLKRAPSEYMNNSVLITLQKSVPFPPPPREYGPRGIIYDLKFTPKQGLVQER